MPASWTPLTEVDITLGNGRRNNVPPVSVRSASSGISGYTKKAAYSSPGIRDSHTEQPRAIINRSRQMLLFQVLLHAIPTSLTLFILSLSARGVYWSDVNNPNLNSQLEALQFAAKIQESFILASLAAVLVYVVTIQLCGDGAPLGLLVASYQFSSLSNLWGMPFWTAMLSSSRVQSRSLLPRAATVILLALVTLLATIMGPVVAVALIPKLGWWPMKVNGWNLTAVNQTSLPNTFYMINNQVPLWPSSLTSSYLPNNYSLCTGAFDYDTPQCLSAGFTTLVNAAWTENVSIPNSGVLRPLLSELIISPSESLFDKPDGHTLTYVASTPTGWLAEVLEYILANRDVTPNSKLPRDSAQLWNRPKYQIANVGNTSAMRPVVQAQCTPFLNTSTTVTFPHDGFNTPPFRKYNFTTDLDGTTSSAGVTFDDNIYTGSNWTIDMDSVWPKAFRDANFRQQYEIGAYFKWIDLSQHFETAPSAAAVIAFPEPFVTETKSQQNQYKTEYIACSIDARWLPTDLWLDPAYDTSVYMSPISSVDLISTLSMRGTASGASPQVSSSPIYISLDWAEGLNLPVPNANHTAIEALMAPISASYPRLQITTSLLSQLMADGLARVNADTTIEYTMVYSGTGQADTIGSLDSPDVTTIKIDFFRYGYAYGISTITFKISTLVLLIYVAVAVGMMVYLLIVRRTATVWSSLGDMLALALKSAPSPAFKNAGAGARRFDTWNQAMQVRDVGDANVELLCRDDEYDGVMTKRVKVGESYS